MNSKQKLRVSIFVENAALGHFFNLVYTKKNKKNHRDGKDKFSLYTHTLYIDLRNIFQDYETTTATTYLSTTTTTSKQESTRF